MDDLGGFLQSASVHDAIGMDAVHLDSFLDTKFTYCHTGKEGDHMIGPNDWTSFLDDIEITTNKYTSMSPSPTFGLSQTNEADAANVMSHVAFETNCWDSSNIGLTSESVSISDIPQLDQIEGTVQCAAKGNCAKRSRKRKRKDTVTSNSHSVDVTISKPNTCSKDNVQSSCRHDSKQGTSSSKQRTCSSDSNGCLDDNQYDSGVGESLSGGEETTDLSASSPANSSTNHNNDNVFFDSEETSPNDINNTNTDSSDNSNLRRSTRKKNNSNSDRYNFRTSSVINRVETERRQVTPKQPKPKTRPPPLSKYRRKTANARERERMEEINQGFEQLQTAIPQLPEGKLTKITTLRLAINYIRALREMLGYEEDISNVPPMEVIAKDQ